MTETQAELGGEMRAARQARGWELPQLAASLRIRQSYLEAIEAGKLAELPGTTYALGFVRAYAAALGMPGEDMARRFRADATLANGQTALRFPAPVPQRGLPAGALMLLGVFILAGAYGGWYWVTEHRATPVETVPPIPDSMVTDAQKPAPSPQVASLLPNTAPPAAAAPARPPSSPIAGGAPAPGVPAPVLTPAPLPSVAQSTQPAPSGPAAGATQQPSPPAAALPKTPAGTRMVIRATADAWLTVKQKSGPPLLNKLLHAGESWPVPADAQGASLTTGNAGATQIDVDGAPMPTSLGGSGAVRRDLPLDADMLKSGKLPPPRARTRPAAAADGQG